MRADITVIPGPASQELGREVCHDLGVAPGAYECSRFPDGEIMMNLEQSVRGRDVYLIQSTSPPVEQHLMELLLLADACRRAGAGRLTAVLPYFGYARQDRRSGRRSVGARVVANALGTAGFERLMLIDAHTPSIEGFFDVPIDHLTAVPLLAQAAATARQDDSVVVAPDLGAVKLARVYARHLRCSMAFVHKTRLDGEAVEAHGVIGSVQGRSPIIVDDMLSTGGTLEAAIGALEAAGAREPVTVVVTHALLVGRAPELLRSLPISRLIAGNSVEVALPPDVPMERASLAPLIAAAIRRDHRDESLADLRASV